MLHAHRYRRPFAWLAILALLVAALAPSVSRALVAHSAGDATWVVLCTAQGIKYVKAEGGTSSDHGSKSRFEHCPLCTLQSAGAAPPPLPGLAFAAPDGKPLAPATFLHAAGTQFIWSPALARGPPALS